MSTTEKKRPWRKCRLLRIIRPLGVLLQVLLLCLFVLPAFGAEKSVPSNLELLRKVLSQAAEEAIQRCPPGSLLSPVSLLAEDENEANWLVESVFTEELTKHGLGVLSGQQLKEGEAPLPQTELFYKILELRISYPKQRRHRVLGTKWVSRLAQVKISVQLASSGRVVWLDDIKASIKDEFPRRSLSWVEDDSYPFTKTEFKERDWNRLLEPAIVSAVVGGLVYLFYSNRQ